MDQKVGTTTQRTNAAVPNAIADGKKATDRCCFDEWEVMGEGEGR